MNDPCTEVLARLPELLEAELGKTEDPELRPLREHLRSCGECREELAKLRLFSEMGRSAAALLPGSADREALASGMERRRHAFLDLVRARAGSRPAAPETPPVRVTPAATLDQVIAGLREMPAASRLLALKASVARVLARVSPSEQPLLELLWQAAVSASQGGGARRGGPAPALGAVGGEDEVGLSVARLIETALWLEAQASGNVAGPGPAAAPDASGPLRLLLEELGSGE